MSSPFDNHAQTLRQAAAYLNLRICCGYVENDSSQAVTVSQDDATKSWTVRCGNGGKFESPQRTYHDADLSRALAAAAEGEKQDG